MVHPVDELISHTVGVTPDAHPVEYRVAAVDIAIWGYSASAVTRDSDVKPIDYTTADV